MQRRAFLVLISVLLALVGCGDDKQPAPAATDSTLPAPAKELPAVPDADGQMVVPVTTGSKSPEKAWLVPDVGEHEDWVSEEDARYLAATRPAVPYSSPEQTISNATLIAIGHRACAEAPTYTAGGATVSGDAAGTVHNAAVVAYC